MSHSSEPAVIIVSGVMASGKSTVAQRWPRNLNAESTCGRRVSENDYQGQGRMLPDASDEAKRRSPCATDYRPPLPEPMLKRVFMSSSRTSFSARANNRNAKRPSVYVVVLNPSENAISAREQIRNKKATGYGPSMS